MKFARTVGVVASLACSSIAAAQHGNAGSARPSLAPAKEASQFEFLVGQWELTVTPKANSLAAKIHGAPKLLGTWKAWRSMDGFGFEDELRISDRSGNPMSLSHGLRSYSANDGKWIITGIDAYRGRVSSSTGEWKNNEMIVTGQGLDEEGKAFMSRVRYFDITPASFKYQADRTYDNGKTWDEGTLKIEAKRVAAAAPR